MTLDSTFLFADIAGFTALTEAHGDEDAADVALDFCRRVRERLRPGEGEVVKAIGDAVMIRMAAPAPAVSLGLDVVHELMAGHGRPGARVGMHTGPAVERDGDFFGATVNVAARIGAAADQGEVLASDAVREATGGLADVRFTPLGPRRLRNVSGPVELFSVECEVRRLADWPVDPVCRMAVAPGQETRVISHAGLVHRFCSESCAALFELAPADYAR